MKNRDSQRSLAFERDTVAAAQAALATKAEAARRVELEKVGDSCLMAAVLGVTVWERETQPSTKQLAQLALVHLPRLVRVVTKVVTWCSILPSISQ